MTTLPSICRCFLLFSFLGLATTTFAAPTANNPVQTLQQIAQAVDNSDAAAFSSLVDLDGILADSLALILSEAQKPETASQLPPLAAMAMAQAAAQDRSGEALRALILKEAKSFVINGINSGAFAGKKLDRNQMNGFLAPLFADVSPGRKEIRNIGDPLRADDGWLLTFEIHDHGNDQDYPLVGHFVPGESGCILKRIENLDQLFQQIQAESQNLGN